MDIKNSSFMLYAVLGAIGIYAVYRIFGIFESGDIDVYEKCKGDYDCRSGQVFGATRRCINGLCTPLVSNKYGADYIPKEINTPYACGRYYLLGLNNRCQKTEQCNQNGLFADIATDPNANFLFDWQNPKNVTCSQGRCKQTVYDWFGAPVDFHICAGNRQAGECVNGPLGDAGRILDIQDQSTDKFFRIWGSGDKSKGIKKCSDLKYWH